VHLTFISYLAISPSVCYLLSRTPSQVQKQPWTLVLATHQKKKKKNKKNTKKKKKKKKIKTLS